VSVLTKAYGKQKKHLKKVPQTCGCPKWVFEKSVKRTGPNNAGTEAKNNRHIHIVIPYVAVV